MYVFTSLCYGKTVVYGRNYPYLLVNGSVSQRNSFSANSRESLTPQRPSSLIESAYYNHNLAIICESPICLSVRKFLKYHDGLSGCTCLHLPHQRDNRIASLSGRRKEERGAKAVKQQVDRVQPKPVIVVHLVVIPTIETSSRCIPNNFSRVAGDRHPKNK